MNKVHGAYLLFSFILALSLFSQAGAVLLEEQVKFDVPDAAVFEQVKDLQQILSYRVKFKGEYIYQDYYYDTADFALFKLGHLFRFRVRDKADGKIEYGIQFKSEYDSSDSRNFQRLELDGLLSAERGAQVLSGDWQAVFRDADTLNTIREFKDFLKENKISIDALKPVIYAKQKRIRLQLKEDSQLYFEISLDDAQFRLIDSPSARQISMAQLEFENKSRDSNQEESQARIKNLIIYFQSIFSLRIQRDSKYRAVVTELTSQNKR